jgi:hypothetical protein
MNPTATPSPRRQRPPSGPRQVPPDERMQALSADLIQAFARIAQRRF